MLRNIIARAKKEKKWLFTHYQGLWFSPVDLEKANAEGRYLWGEVNWTLRDPQEHLCELRRVACVAEEEAVKFEKLLEGNR